ncbi:MAG: hypothetical protein AAB074_12990 [Planctomycetota bacterium]
MKTSTLLRYRFQVPGDSLLGCVIAVKRDVRARFGLLDRAFIDAGSILQAVYIPPRLRAAWRAADPCIGDRVRITFTGFDQVRAKVYEVEVLERAPSPLNSEKLK